MKYIEVGFIQKPTTSNNIGILGRTCSIIHQYDHDLTEIINTQINIQIDPWCTIHTLIK